jgi:hypothetical protein
LVNWREGGAAGPRVLISPRSAFFLVLALAFASLACWSFASPLIAAPDEQAHVLRAYALDHGQLGSSTTPPSKVLENVTVPTSLFYTAIYPICWHMHADIPATCSAAWPTSEKPTTIPIYVDHYPPLYYLFVGTASYVSQERSGVYMMRLISSLMGAIMLAVAAYAIARWSRRRALYAGMYVALVPEAYFLSSAVNPGGFEIMTSICLWTLVAIFALERRADPPKGLVVSLGVVASVFVLIRGLSPLWLALAGASLIFLSGPRALYEQVKARRELQFAGGGVVATALLALAWIFTQGTLNILPVGAAVPKSDSMFAVLRVVMGFVQGWLRESVGILGWLDTELPSVVYQSWYAVVIGVLVVALARGGWREKIVVATLSALTVVIPVALVTRQAKVLGVVWQGRDNLPLAVGAVIMAFAVCAGPAQRNARRAIARFDEGLRRRISKFTLVGVVGVLAIANFLSFYTNLRRYAVGRYGPAFFFLHHQGWSPPTGQFATLLVYGLATVAFAGILMVWIWFSPRPDELA